MSGGLFGSSAPMASILTTRSVPRSAREQRAPDRQGASANGKGFKKPWQLQIPSMKTKAGF
jgi:hypothetical protein